MQTVLLIVLAILPALALLWYFERKDKGRKEPRKLKWKIFWWGVLATVFAIFIELQVEGLWLQFVHPVFDKWIYIFLTSFITAAVVEEGLKMWVVKTHVFKNKHFDEFMDGITYAIIASLGFATAENIMYVLDGGVGVAVIRAIFSVPGHAMFSGIMGFYIGIAKFSIKEKRCDRYLWTGFGFAVLYHGTFNFLLFTEIVPLILLVIPLMVIMALHIRHCIKKAHRHDIGIGNIKVKPPTTKPLST